MSFDVDRKIAELKEKCPDPRDPAGVMHFREKSRIESCPPTYGIVVDNRDPECLGRLRVMLPLVAPDKVTPWYSVLGHNKKNKSGWWVLPDIGTQVIVCFPYKRYSHGVVLGCIYDMKHRPPSHSTENPSDSYLIQTKNHRLEIINEDGKEEIRLETAEGKMRAILGKKGIELINELDGGIEINCKKINIKGKNIHLKAKKDFTLNAKGNITLKEKGKLSLTSDKEIKLKGKNIKLIGKKGVTAEKKQIAGESDKVMGFDVHVMVVPAGTSTANVPLPHPFIGQMKEGLSNNVRLGNRQCATKDSVAKHNDSNHMQLPGTIKFQKNPSKDGKVTGGTISSVKINGKETAVIGSTVTTCNDVGAQNNSTIVSIGASIPMPSIINPLNNDEYKKERDKDKKEAGFETVKWASASVNENEEVELSASVKDIEDDNMVTLQVFPEGKGPEDGAAIASFPCKVVNGSVSAKWKYKGNDKEVPPDDDPKFVFSANSAWCNFKKSSNTLTVKLTRPEVTKAEWKDEDGNVVNEVLAGDEVKLFAETKFISSGVTFNIFDHNKRLVTSVGAEVKDNKAEAILKVKDNRMPENTEKLKYIIEAKADRCNAVESNECRIKNPKLISVEWDEDTVYYNDKLNLKIKTFEIAEDSPSCKLCFYEKGILPEEEPLFEQELTVDKDEIEKEIEICFETEDVITTKKLKSIDVYVVLRIEDKDYIEQEPTNLNIQMGDINYE